MRIDPGGWAQGALRVASPNHDERPAGSEITLLLLHSISLPPGKYGGDEIALLFANHLDPAAHPYFRDIAHLRLSSHFLVRRDASLVQFVPLQRRAWHAGASSWRKRERCNDFSIGVELEGTDDSDFEPLQYETLIDLVCILRDSLPLRDIAAHSDVAPGRKTDPGARFDWARLLGALSRRADARS